MKIAFKDNEFKKYINNYHNVTEKMKNMEYLKDINKFKIE